MDYAFGPSNGKLISRCKLTAQADREKKTGITRLKRWERAKQDGLDPPEEVKQIIERHGATSECNKRYVKSLGVEYQSSSVHYSSLLQSLEETSLRDKIIYQMIDLPF